ASVDGISSIAVMITGLGYFAIGFAVVMLIVLIASNFIPFSSHPGRRMSPLISLAIVEIIIVALAGIYFWEARGSLKARYASETAVTQSESSPEILDPQ